MKQKLRNTILKFGLTGGVVIIGLFMVTYFLDDDPIDTTRNFDILAIPVVVFFAIKEFKDYHNNKTLQFWQGMSIGMGVFTLIGILTSLFVFGFIEFIDPDILQGYINAKVEFLISKKDGVIENFGEEVYQQGIKDVKKTTSSAISWDNLVKKSVVGMMITIFVSILLRKTELLR